MRILEALVAFSLLMIVFSTMVSAFVEMFHRLTNRREVGFKKLVDRLYDDLIERFLPHRLSDIGTGSPGYAAARDAFRSALTENRGLLRTTPTTDEWWAGIAKCWNGFSNWAIPRRVTRLEPVEFARRLAETEIGREIARAGDSRTDLLVEETVTRFEDYGVQTREYFKQRAYVLSVLFSLAFAFAANVDAFRILERLIDDPNLRAGITGQADKIVADFQTQSEKKAQAIEDAAKAASAAPAAGDADPEKTRQENRQAQEKQIAELKKLAADTRARLDKLETEIPIGYAYYPGCLPTKDESGKLIPPFDPKCKNLDPAGDSIRQVVWARLCENPLAFIKWIVTVLISGLLIGLGGPFWFDMYTRLAKVLGLAKAVSNILPKRAEGQGDAGSGGEPKQGETTGQQNETPVEAFKRVSGTVVQPGGRAILGPDGEPL